MVTDPALSVAGYDEALRDLKGSVRSARLVAQRRVNTELVLLYWRIGATLNRHVQRHRWGSAVMTRVADDLRREFPDMRGFSARNLFYMRALARAWPDEAKVQRSVALLPWGHVVTLVERLDAQADRDWYASRSLEHGWSRNVLEHHIRTRLHERSASAPTNFDRALGAEQSDLARQLTKDPYVLDFLAVDGDAAERELERALVDRIIDTLRELGEGFAFVGRQVHFEVDGDDFHVDLLFFHVEQLRYVVIELKTGRFRPEQLGQLGFYVALVDDRLRRPHHADTVGLLLVAGKTDAVGAVLAGRAASAGRRVQLRPPARGRASRPAIRGRARPGCPGSARGPDARVTPMLRR